MEDVVALKTMDIVLPDLRMTSVGTDDWETNSNGGDLNLDAGSPTQAMSRMLQEFEVNVVKEEGNEFGLYLSIVDGIGLLVHSIREGLVFEWNTNNPECQVMKGDCIVSVNGIGRDPIRFVELIKSEPTLNLLVKRATTFLVKIEKESDTDRLGIDLSHLPDDKTLIVNEIGQGRISQWNSSTSGQQVRRGDRVVKVNAICNNAQKMLDLIGRSRSLRLLMFRIDGCV